MLAAVVPAWAAQSGDLDQLLGVFIVALPKVPGHRRMGLMEGLLRSVGIDRGLPRALLLLIRTQVEGVGEATQEEGEGALNLGFVGMYPFLRHCKRFCSDILIVCCQSCCLVCRSFCRFASVTLLTNMETLQTIGLCSIVTLVHS